MIRATLIGLVLGLAACGPSRPEPKERAGPSYSYRVELSFTPRALERLAGLGEKVVIASLYYGRAGEDGEAGASGQVGLGQSTLKVEPVDQIVRVSVAPFEADRLARIEGEPMALIDVFSEQRSGADDLIRCGTFKDRLSKAQEAPIAISCDLVEPEIVVAPETPAPAGEP